MTSKPEAKKIEDLDLALTPPENKILFGKESNINFLHVSTLNIYKNLLEKKFKR